MSIVTNRYRGTTDYTRVLAELVHAAEYRGPTTYQDLLRYNLEQLTKVK